MAILRVKDGNGNWIEIPAIVGPPGKDGTMSFEELTDEQRESLRGEPGLQGNSIIGIGKAAGDVTGSTLEIKVMDYATGLVTAYTFPMPEGTTGPAY